MAAKIILIIIAVINGGWMLFNGLHLLNYGNYYGPPGLWADLIASVGIDPMNVGELFVLFGSCWLAGAIGLMFNRRWTLELFLGISIATLWYLPFGTILSIAFLIILLTYKHRIYK